MKVIRVFPRRTSYTPADAYAFVGDPPLWRPEADEVHISCCFSWDIAETERLHRAWEQYYPGRVYSGGPVWNSDGDFVPGLYVRQGVTITSRGCNNRCPWCLVPEREGKFRTLPITPGYIIQDNNLLQAPKGHLEQVFAMLKSQRRAAIFAGGLDARLVSDWVAGELRGLRIGQVFLACDTEEAIIPLRKALAKLSFLPREKLRCYVLCAFGGEAVEQARARLEEVWEAGAMPFCQNYQPPEKYIAIRQNGKPWPGSGRGQQ